MKVAIRVDSSSQIGSGHLMRCLTLAVRYQKEGHDVFFICRDLPGNLTKLVEEKGFQLKLLSAAKPDDSLTGYGKWLTVTQEKDAQDTFAVMQRIGKVDQLVVDSYAIDIDWEKRLRPYVDKLMVIDDLANRRHDCDILLDQNFYLNCERRYQGLVPKECKLLLGPRYALLRDEFLQVKKMMGSRQTWLQHILVFYGGADATDETSKAIRALNSMRADGELDGIEVTVIAGGSNVYRDGVARLCLDAGFQYLCQVSNMAELMAAADLMLGAGGSTTWERCYLGLPSIVTAVAENQLEICKDCSEAGFIHYLGSWEDVTEKDICMAVGRFKIPDNLLAMQRKAGSLFD